MGGWISAAIDNGQKIKLRARCGFGAAVAPSRQSALCMLPSGTRERLNSPHAWIEGPIMHNFGVELLTVGATGARQVLINSLGRGGRRAWWVMSTDLQHEYSLLIRSSVHRAAGVPACPRQVQAKALFCRASRVLLLGAGRSASLRRDGAII